MERIRRKPEAIVKSFEMDPDKKAIYVEGHNDRLFFEYIFENQLNEETVFLEIDSVDIPKVEQGGNRQRLINFAQLISDLAEQARCFIDADHSRILKHKLPKSIILTDFRDLEAYLCESKYLNKFIKVGLKTDKITPQYILNEISNARDIAILRLCSEENEYNFPFQKTNENFSRYYQLGNGIEIKKYVAALIQNSQIEEKYDAVMKVFELSKNKFKVIGDRDLLHGKDILKIIKEIAKSLNYKKDNIELIFWMSFDRSDINKFPALTEVKEFIE